eukprot:9016350-Pyramimonas_sp.AAC.1
MASRGPQPTIVGGRESGPHVCSARSIGKGCDTEPTPQGRACDYVRTSRLSRTPGRPSGPKLRLLGSCRRATLIRRACGRAVVHLLMPEMTRQSSPE